MSIESRSFSTDELVLGMYVSGLDRPWTETPFLFQGFHIESPKVIKELRRYCKFVYVDIEKSDDTIAFIARQAPPPRRKSEGGDSEPRMAASPKTEAPDLHAIEGEESARETTTLKAELVDAELVHRQTERVIEDLFARIRSGESIEIGDVEQALDPMLDSIIRNDHAMSWLARMRKKNDYVHDHSIASSVWAMIFGKHLGLKSEDLQILGIGAVFMDVGKTRIPTEYLIKRETLSPEEMGLMKRHVSYGVEIVSALDGIDPRVVEMVRCHHERHNGTGYPEGLTGVDIPIFSRIAGIVDAYDAMTTQRPYAEAVSTFDAMRQLNNLAGVEFAAEMVEQFVQAIGVFPVGTLVELSTGEVGVVIAQNRIRRLRPKVMLLLDSDKKPIETTPIVDLRNQLADSRGENSLWIETGLPPGAYGLDAREYYL